MKTRIYCGITIAILSFSSIVLSAPVETPPGHENKVKNSQLSQQLALEVSERIAEDVNTRTMIQNEAETRTVIDNQLRNDLTDETDNRVARDFAIMLNLSNAAAEREAANTSLQNQIDTIKSTAGLSCWDLNDNTVCDQSEDIDSNGFCDAMDCQGKMSMPPQPEPPENPALGDMYYSDTEAICVYMAAGWVKIVGDGFCD